MNTWYAARFPDKGAGATHGRVYVQAPDEETARAIAGECDRYTVFDATAGTLEPTEHSREAIEERLVMAGGPNEAITAEGDVIRRRDVRPDLFE